MSFLRDNPRKLKSATQVEAINRIIEKYVDLKELFLRVEFKREPIEYLERPEDDVLVLRFKQPLEEDHVEIFTVLRERFIDFVLEKISAAGPAFPDYSYNMRITKCSIALDKREHERYEFVDEFPMATNIATIKIRERESDFRKSLSVRMIVEEFIGKIDGVDIKKVQYKEDKDITPVVQYVMESGSTLHIPDMSDLPRFFKENGAVLENIKSAELRDDLQRWLQNNNVSIKSLVVMPVMYQPLVGKEFPIAYLTAINKDTVIDAARVERIRSSINDLSERVRNGNLVESKLQGKIIDVSAGGVKIELGDSKMIEKLVTQNVIMLEMNFKEENPIVISGQMVWVYKLDDGRCMIGIDFHGSRFGPRMKSALAIHVQNFISRTRH
ncbi:MAG: DUF1577 domain-containing protein [Spirochaetes bacterium]|nr:DUF1577 domain-containing protein [Spirochaetota bacterium]